MLVYIDLLGFAAAEYVEHDGVKGVFIPEVPNFRYQKAEYPKQKTRYKIRSRAVASFSMSKAMKKKYDYVGRQRIPEEHQDAYMSNPSSVRRGNYVAYGYKWPGEEEGKQQKVMRSDIEKLLDE